MTTSNGESETPRKPLELSETLFIETGEGQSLAFEVVGILEDPGEGASYAVLHHDSDDGEDEFIVTDEGGKLLEDEGLAQEILDDFLAYADEDDDRAAQNGETN
ncbi:MAG TPA: hypothetical protein VFE16_03500 [Candidatus Cybelea sp.]|jgi:hypothetical protein|nr:hypothetical protein [Candidatus Cybelea sp.]